MKFLLIITLITFSGVHSQNKIDAILDKGFSEKQSNNPEEAIKDATRIILDSATSYRQKMRAYQLLSGAYSVQGKNRLSIQSSFKAKEIADQLDDTYFSALSLCSIAECYRRLDLSQESLENYQKALDILRNLPLNNENLHTIASIHYEKGNVMYSNNQYIHALKNYQEALAVLKNLKSEPQKADKQTENYLLIGGCYIYMKKYDSAEICLKISQNIASSNKNKFIVPYLMESYSKLYMKKSDYRRALDSAKKGIKVMDFDDTKLKLSLREILAKCYSELGDTENAKKNYNNYLLLNNKYNDDKNNAISFAFSQSKRVLNKEVNKQKNVKIILGIILFLVFIISIITISLYRHKARKNKRLYLQAVDRIVINNSVKEISPKNTRYSSAYISEEKETELLQKLENFEKSHMVINKKLTISSLASHLDTNVTYLSQIISKNKKSNFNHYINSLKIAYIINKLYTNPNYRNYKIAYLAEECGLPYSSFTSIFKNITGMSPSAFVKEVNLDKVLKNSNL